MKKYYDQTFSVKGLKDCKFKIDKLNPNEYLTVVFAVTQTAVSKDLKFNDDTHKKMLKMIKFNKTGDEWFPIINMDGSARLPELDEKPTILIYLLNKFRDLVIEPAFTE